MATVTLIRGRVGQISGPVYQRVMPGLNRLMPEKQPAVEAHVCARARKDWHRV